MTFHQLQPDNFELETSTVWSFPRRGSWATHNSKYRGNWAPEVVRNLILRYSQKGDYVLDPMVGGGTTLIECKLTGRNCLGIDINPEAVKLSKKAVDFDFDSSVKIKAREGNATQLDFLGDDSIDLVATHPPYGNIIKYSDGKIKDDLSNIGDLNIFYDQMETVAQEICRVLKPGKYCAVLIGDTRQNKHYVPIASHVMQRFLKSGFILKENIIKHQWNTKTEGLWAERSKKFNFLLILHEQLFVFRKPQEDEDINKCRFSINEDVFL